MTTRGSGEIDWYTYDLPSRIDDPSDSSYSQFWYGADRSRIKQYRSTGETITYVGELFEYEDAATDTARYYVHAGTRVVAMVERVGSTNTTQYLHRDHQNSITKITSSSGSVTESLAYDAWGLRRNPSTWAPLSSPFGGSHETDRGYTGHVHLDNVGLIHMNGRVQDPRLGRFISADPFVQAPYHTQSHNRFSYVMNNPATLVDPSGFQWANQLSPELIYQGHDAVMAQMYVNWSASPITRTYEWLDVDGNVIYSHTETVGWDIVPDEPSIEEGSAYGFWSAGADLLQVVIGIAGQVPGWGEFADGGNFLISSLRQDEIGASMDLVSMTPLYGNASGLTNTGRRGMRLGGYVVDQARRAADAFGRGMDRMQSIGQSLLDWVAPRGGRQRLGDLDAFASQRGGPRSRHRDRGQNPTDAALQQLEEIEEHQRRVRQGQSDAIIDSIEKSKQRVRNALRPHNIEIEDLDDI